MLTLLIVLVRGGQAPCFVWALVKCFRNCDRL